MPRIIQRTEWGASRRDGFRDRPLPAPEVDLHHSAGAATNAWQEIRDLEATCDRKFGGGMCYHYLLNMRGDIFEGTSAWRVAAHNDGENYESVGICLVGNFEAIHPSRAMIDNLVWLVAKLHLDGVLRTPAITRGHRDTDATLCPGINAYRLIPDINRRARNGVNNVALLDESYTDWAGNPQTVEGTLNNMDKRIWEIRNILAQYLEKNFEVKLPGRRERNTNTGFIRTTREAVGRLSEEVKQIKDAVQNEPT